MLLVLPGSDGDTPHIAGDAELGLKCLGLWHRDSELVKHDHITNS